MQISLGLPPWHDSSKIVSGKPGAVQSLFWLLGYVEPVLLLFVSLGLLGESFTQQKLATYAPIWLAVGLIGIHGALHMRSPKR
ncbi:EamA domain-containing membrane protein RarD [Paraburkholderia sp. JPY465]